jgi:murein DD-endopeptidase MepM/ murein hydrolase activator NlpD
LICFIKPQFKILSYILVLSLLFGTLFVPLVEASFLSSILGNEASADIMDSISSSQAISNSQTMALLQANVSSVPILQDKGKGDDKSEIDLNIVSENALLATTSPMGTSDGTLEDSGSFSDQISVYVVRKGDSISQIADMFGVSVNTILWANDMKKGDKLVEDDVLFILPISGIEHIIAKGETLNSIAKLYKADIVDIARFNGIAEGEKLTVGDKIIVPGGEIYNESTPSLKTNTNNGQYKTPNVNVAGYFINPVPAYSRRSQGLHGPGKRGIDLAAPTGTQILASAGGTVLIARNGWNGAYGNMIIIQHPNGTKTLYGHLSKISTTTGAQVSQGQVIGNVGSTGRSTGPHLHFEVFNAKNPGGTTPMTFSSR